MNIFRFIKQGRALTLKLNSRSIFKTLKSGNYERNTLTSTALKVEITKFTGDLAQNRRVYIQWKLKACKIWKLFVEKNTEVWLPYWAGVRFLPYSAFCYLNNKSLYFLWDNKPPLSPFNEIPASYHEQNSKKHGPLTCFSFPIDMPTLWKHDSCTVSTRSVKPMGNNRYLTVTAM